MRTLALLMPALVGCKPSPKPDDTAADLADRVVAVTITPGAVATVSERFLSFAVDSGQVAGIVFWNPDPTGPEEIPVDPYDFSREKLRGLTAELSPAWLRIGGTDADVLYYDLAGELAGEEPPEPYEGVLDAAVWDGVVDFATDLDLQIHFTVNAGPGPRDEDRVWQPDNLDAFMAEVARRGDPVGAWEFGNEPNGFQIFHGFTLQPDDWATGARQLAALRDTHTPEALVLGPANAYWPISGEFLPYTDPAVAAAGDALDVITWHYYPQQSVRCPVQNVLAGPEVMLDPERLDELDIWADEVEASRDAHAPAADVWLGETGNAQCGGTPGVSDVFAGTFWWVDQMGSLARRGQPVVVRQTLSGSDYGLIDDVTLEPTPDWWASVLWRRLMGTDVLDVTSDDPTLRVYAHCAADGSGKVAAVAINLDDADTVQVDIGAKPTGVWTLTADALTTREVRLNGAVLTADSSGAAGALPGAEASAWVVPPRGISFATLAADCG